MNFDSGTHEKRPNIVYIFADQLRYDSLGSSGNGIIQTPHLDRLAADGVVLDQAFSSCPLCSPYRAQLITGRYAHKNGVMDNEYTMKTGQATIYSTLKDFGYATAYIGKWHLGYGPYIPDKRYGLDYMFAYNCDHLYYNVNYFENENGPIQTREWSPVVETSKSIEYIEDHCRNTPDVPFSLHLSFAPPHNNVDVSTMSSELKYSRGRYDIYPKEFDIYNAARVPLNPNVPTPLEAIARSEIADYYGNVSALDAQVGRLMEKLDELGIADDTIVVFSSDHGDHIRCHGYGTTRDLWLHHSKRINKATPYEEAIHIPFILRYPRKVAKGRRSRVLFNSVDVMPSLLGLCNFGIPEGVQGQDLSHAMTGEDGHNPDSVYLQILGPGWPNRGKGTELWRGLRTNRWTYARFLHPERLEKGVWLFDRENDPHELKNLSGSSETMKIETELEERLKRWMRDTDDPYDYGQRDPVSDMLMLGQDYNRRPS